MRNLCVVFYGSHSTSIDQKIINAQPKVFVANAPNGSWNGACNVSKFQNAGVNTYNYISVGYCKDFKYAANSPANDYTTVTNKIKATASATGTAKCFGVFFDECVTNSDTAGLNSWSGHTIKDVCNLAHSLGLAVILNPGTLPSSNLYQFADYVMTDEQYINRSPKTGEVASKTIVIGYGLSSATTAATYTNTALEKGFALSYHCSSYTGLPSWFDSYVSLIPQTVIVQPPPVTPPPVEDAEKVALIAEVARLKLSITALESSLASTNLLVTQLKADKYSLESVLSGLQSRISEAVKVLSQ